MHPARLRACFKRLESDAELRTRARAAVPSWRRALFDGLQGEELDRAVELYAGLQRRLVEDCA